MLCAIPRDLLWKPLHKKEIYCDSNLQIALEFDCLAWDWWWKPLHKKKTKKLRHRLPIIILAFSPFNYQFSAHPIWRRKSAPGKISPRKLQLQFALHFWVFPKISVFLKNASFVRKKSGDVSQFNGSVKKSRKYSHRHRQRIYKGFDPVIIALTDFSNKDSDVWSKTQIFLQSHSWTFFRRVSNKPLN